MKRIIRLTEGDLHKIVKESVINALNEAKKNKRISPESKQRMIERINSGYYDYSIRSHPNFVYSLYDAYRTERDVIDLLHKRVEYVKEHYPIGSPMPPRSEENLKKAEITRKRDNKRVRLGKKRGWYDDDFFPRNPALDDVGNH